MINCNFQRLLMLLTVSWLAGSCIALADGSRDRSADASWRGDHFASYLPTFQSGDTLPKEDVFDLALRSVASVVYLMRSTDWIGTGYGGVVTFENLTAGRYVIVLSQDAVVEAVQPHPVSSIVVAHKKSKTDPLSHREIAVAGGPLTLQLSGAPAPSITVAVFRLPD